MSQYGMVYSATVSSTRTTPAFPFLRNRNAFSVQVNIGGDLVTALELQSSIDGVNWATVSGTEVAAADAANSPVMYDLSGISPIHLRVLLTVDSGSGLVEVWTN